jgi:hypothetical protein
VSAARPLAPFDPAEAIPVREAAVMIGRTTETVRNWAERHGLGRKIGGRWFLSRAAFAMFLAGDREALNAYQAGDRAGPNVRAYFNLAAGQGG